MRIEPARIEAIGEKARAALRGGSPIEVLCRLTGSCYLRIGDDLVWLGENGAALHPRAVVVSGRQPSLAGLRGLGLDHARVWAPGRPQVAAEARIEAALDVLSRHIRALGTPRGMGPLLVGEQPPFPLDRVAQLAAKFAGACGAGNVQDALASGRGLIGLGPGLTPSGDDFIGGVLFAQHLGPRAAEPEFSQICAGLLAEARRRSTTISAALLEDLAHGLSFVPLHGLASAVAESTDTARLIDAARRLVRIGCSSGWDMLAGFMAGIGGIRFAQ